MKDKCLSRVAGNALHVLLSSASFVIVLESETLGLDRLKRLRDFSFLFCRFFFIYFPSQEKQKKQSEAKTYRVRLEGSQESLFSRSPLSFIYNDSLPSSILSLISSELSSMARWPSRCAAIGDIYIARLYIKRQYISSSATVFHAHRDYIYIESYTGFVLT